MREFVHSKQFAHPFHTARAQPKWTTKHCGTFKELKIATGRRRRSMQTNWKFLALDNLGIPADCFLSLPLPLLLPILSASCLFCSFFGDAGMTNAPATHKPFLRLIKWQTTSCAESYSECCNWRSSSTGGKGGTRFALQVCAPFAPWNAKSLFLPKVTRKKMLKSDQSVLRLELEEDKAKPKPCQITYTQLMTHTTTKCVCLCVWVSAGPAAKWKVSCSPRSTVRNNLSGEGRGSNGRIYVLKQPI